MFPASLVMVVFWRLSFSKCTYRDLSEGGVIFNEEGVKIEFTK